MTIVAHNSISNNPQAPNQFGGLALWLDASQLTGLVDGNAVASWTDMTGKGNHAIQATEANKPLYKTNILNGKPVVRFDGTDFLTSPNGAISGLSNAISIFAVYNMTVQTDTSILVAETDDTANRLNIHPNFSGGTVFFDFGNISTGGRVNGAWGGALGTFYRWGFVAGSSAMNIYRNGTSILSVGTSKTFTPGIKTLNIGAYSATRFNGDVAEIIIYNRVLSAIERAFIDSYLSNKYAIV